ncbi:hypothetical protein EZS27_009063 [termite gut metagenome]|uniref:Uncharacterized protein n=1 Tax=termite gut metagenome TaxID=433724 RepID=A0A5J4SD65_9ZZZZ
MLSEFPAVRMLDERDVLLYALRNIPATKEFLCSFVCF